MDVNTPLRELPGVGEARAKGLEKLGPRSATVRRCAKIGIPV